MESMFLSMFILLVVNRGMAPSVNENRDSVCKMHLAGTAKKNKGLCCMDRHRICVPQM